MSRIKEKQTKIIEWIKAKKGYCIGAAALIVLLVLGLQFLDIETVEQHNARQNAETEERQEILAQLEAQSEEQQDSVVDAVSKEAINEQGEDNAASGTALITADTNQENGEVGNDEATNKETANAEATNQNTDGSSNGNANADTSATEQNQSSNVGQSDSQGISNNQNQSQTINQSGSQSTANNQNQSQSTNQNGGESITNSQNQSQTTNQNQSQSATNNQNQSQGSGENASQESGGNTSDSQSPEEYILVNVKIVCDSVVNHPDLSTSAKLPANGIILQEKTAIKKGETVFDALKAVCTDYGISYTNRGPASSAYVTSIGGLAEKECGKYSGWKYKVNGAVSGKSCGAHKLNNNDVVEWYFAISTTQ